MTVEVLPGDEHNARLVANVHPPASIEGQNPRPAAPGASLGAAGRCFVGPTGTCSGLRIGLCLSGLPGTGAGTEPGPPDTCEPKSAQPTGSTCLLGGISTGVPPLLMAVEAVAAGASGVTYRVSWGIETAQAPEPPKTVEAETQPSNNLLGPRLILLTDADYTLIPAERHFTSGRF